MKMRMNEDGCGPLQSDFKEGNDKSAGCVEKMVCR